MEFELIKFWAVYEMAWSKENDVIISLERYRLSAVPDERTK